jgi:hypothetical protein
MALDIGRIAFQAHQDYLNKVNYREPELWEEIGKERQDAWRQAACAVLEYIDKERFRYLWSLDQKPEDIEVG